MTALALTGFAANSLLCRAALSGGGAQIDAATFTSVRLLSGAAMLWILLKARRRTGESRGTWGSAAALFAYAAGFSFAYVRIPAGIGALVLFGLVQLTMFGTGIARGERPGMAVWSGLAVAFGGLVVLTAPGAASPSAPGVLLMASAGIAWGIYSLRGRGSSDPLAVTADNFLRSVPFALALSLSAAVLGDSPRATTAGITLAMASGALASGVGYSVWYAALPHLTATRASVVQLSVPLLTATGGIVLLDESLTPRVAIAAAALITGVTVAVLGKNRTARR